MKRKHLLAALASVGVVAMLNAGAGADEPRNGVRVEINTQRVSPETVMHHYRASKVIGMTVKNGTGADIASINDFVLDLPKGKVKYFAVSYGGFLGLGNKLFAVPPGAFDFRHADDGTPYMVLDVSEERMKNAPGFDQNDWPNFADAKWQQTVNDYYQLKQPVGQ